MLGTLAGTPMLGALMLGIPALDSDADGKPGDSPSDAVGAMPPADVGPELGTIAAFLFSSPC